MFPLTVEWGSRERLGDWEGRCTGEGVSGVKPIKQLYMESPRDGKVYLITGGKNLSENFSVKSKYRFNSPFMSFKGILGSGRRLSEGEVVVGRGLTRETMSTTWM